MIDKSKLVKVKPGQENQGVSSQQRKNLAEYGREVAHEMGLDEPCPELAKKNSKDLGLNPDPATVSMEKDLKYWLRWFAILPGALLAGLLFNFPLHWVMYSTLENFVTPYPELPERVLSPLITAYAFVWCGSYIAPEHKLKASIALLSAWLFLAGGFYFAALSGNSFFGTHLFLRANGIALFMGTIGAFLGFYFVKRQATKKTEKIKHRP